MMNWVMMVVVWCMWVAWGSVAAWGQSGAGEQIRAANKQVVRLFQTGKREEALQLAEETVRKAEQLLGVDHPDTATTLNNLAYLYQKWREYGRAEPLYQLALAIREKALGSEHPDTATTLNGLAELYRERGKYEQAEPLYQRALAILEKKLGPKHLHTAMTLGNLAELYRERGEYEQAEPLYQRALAIFEKSQEPEYLYIPTALNNLATLYRERGEYGQAESLYQRALAILEKAQEPEHLDIAAVLNNLATLYSVRGEYEQAEPLYQRVLTICKKMLGAEHPNTATALGNLAVLYKARGEYGKAKPLYQQALAIREKVLGAEHPDTAMALGNLAELYKAQGEYGQAELLYQRALTIWRETLGANHRDIAATLNNLAELYRERGEYEQARPLYQQALTIHEKALGADHPDTAAILSNLATLYDVRGEYGQAEPLYQRALTIHEKALGTEHPSTAQVLNNLAVFHWKRGHLQEASNLAWQEGTARDRLVRVNIASQSEAVMQTIVQSFLGASDFPLSAHLGIQHESGRERAAQVILSRKGLIQEAVENQYQALLETASPETKEKLNTLRTKRAELSALMYKQGSVSQHDLQRLARVGREAEQIEAELAQEYPAFREATQAPSVEEIRQSLPLGTVLIEFYRYQRYSQGQNATPQKPHYAVYVLGAPEDGAAEDMGEAEAIDSQVTLLREALQSSGNEQVVREIGAQLYQTLFARFAPQLASAQRVLISPDGALSLMPFEVLVDEHGQYLVQRWEVGYVATARDLRQWQTQRHSQGQVVAFVNPNYDAKAQGKAQSSREKPLSMMVDARTRRTSPGGQFMRLLGADSEGQVIQERFPQALVFRDSAATEQALKGLHGPRILHLATHGFVLQDREVQALPMAQVVQGKQELQPFWDNPMLRAGVALAGANVAESDGIEEDGLLTAVEAARLDLRGTQLVVLSACETGLGKVQYGEGVMGLRRAFTLAGARAQLFSLVAVSDTGTVELIKNYYQHLAAGQGHTASLRAVQLEMLKNGVDPYIWASFVAYGAPGPLGE